MIKKISAKELFQIDEDFSMILFDLANENVIYCPRRGDLLKTFKYSQSQMKVSFSLKDLSFISFNQEADCIIFQERQGGKYLVFSMELQKYVDFFELKDEL